ncbi:MAG TPA: hypothetical protein VMP68_04215 [Candidatus Eisenbacteria bacterium]|nr:hypothetical protein [Candidatus Eisenbacteria bacterium]
MKQGKGTGMRLSGDLSLFSLLLAAVFFGLPQAGIGQATSGDQSWSSSTQLGSPDGNINPTRTASSHTQSGDRTNDRTSVERVGQDGRYIPYSDIEKETVRVNDTTSRTIERMYGRDADGHRTLIQERQEETRTLPGGEQKVTRTMSNPDGDRKLQVVRREQENSKQVSPGVRVTNTTLLMPDMNGGFSAAVRTEQRETQDSDGTIKSTKSTLITDSTGGWKLSEVRESTSKPESAGVRSKEESVLRPDANGQLAVVERTVSKEAQDGSGEKRATVEKYSTDVPGVAGDNGLQLVQRETTMQRSSTGGQSTVQRVEEVHPGSLGGELGLTQETIDIVRPNGSGAADQSHTILTTDSDGRLNQVLVDIGKTGDPGAVKVDTKAPAKPAAVKAK